MPRLFVGTFLSEEQQVALERIKEMNSDLAAKWQCHIRWVNYKKLHLTWLFLGDVERTKITELSQALAGAAKKNPLNTELTLTYDRLEVWSVRGTPRHIVLVPKNVSPKFFQLANHIRNALMNFVSKDSQAQAKQLLRPHVTLMRLEKLEALQAHLPVLLDADKNHPLKADKRLQSSELDYAQILGMSELMPVVYDLTGISLIESASNVSGHHYTVLQEFVLTPRHLV